MPSYNRVSTKNVEKAFYWKPQPFQPKPVLFETVDLSRTRSNCSECSGNKALVSDQFSVMDTCLAEIHDRD